MGQLPILTGEVVRVMLPSTKDLPAEQQDWVELERRPILAHDMFVVDDTRNRKTIERDMLTPRIKKWSYTEADGSMSPINTENVGRLDINDFELLLEKMDSTKLTEEVVLDTEDTKSGDVVSPRI